ncbi:hypothetical protein [Marinobacter adhaerens]|uniref:Uncharacterized protein n=2 Tax=Marinobacter adhaerens TaxID=1033846 RepID=A0ABX8IFC6_9GAMM|nr:hypothetical protein [Marinobacter adhaerens]ADP97764.1 conserved hypothetical protein [Marinobacter adhaerens HP15]QWV11820.1 hypothetical protein KQ249_14125 [Marinobacter adhaerens]
MTDMEKDVFAHTAFGKLALKKMQPVPDNFRLFEAGWLGEQPKDWEVMEVKGAEFRRAKSGPRKGRLAIKIRGTERTVYLTKDQIKEESSGND